MNALTPMIEARDTTEAIKSYIHTNKPAVGRMVSSTFEIRTMDEAEKLSTMLATQFPDPDRVAAGIWELLSNAIEHGNLEFDCDDKTRLLFEGTFFDEVERRLVAAPYADRVALVEFRRTKTRISLRITDEGKGFDYAAFLDAEFNFDRPNGRGIAIAKRMAFDRLAYKGRGNVVEAWVRV